MKQQVHASTHPDCLRRRRRGYTYLEIALVVGIVALLASVAVGTFSRARRSGHRARCDVQIKSLALALDAYRQEQGFYPGDLKELRTDAYVQDAGIMRCPADPDPNGNYDDYYMVRSPRDAQDLPLLVCPYHEGDGHGNQAYIGRYTTQFMTKPAVLETARSATVTRPGKAPVAAPAGMELHGADVITTANNGSATIRFADGSTVRLRHNSSLTILQSYINHNTPPVLYTLVRQKTGVGDYSIHTGSKFDVVTPAATAGALGTEFTVTVDSDTETTLLVTHGKVRFNNNRKRYKVNNGQNVKAKKNKP